MKCVTSPSPGWSQVAGCIINARMIPLAQRPHCEAIDTSCKKHRLFSKNPCASPNALDAKLIRQSIYPAPTPALAHAAFLGLHWACVSPGHHRPFCACGQACDARAGFRHPAQDARPCYLSMPWPRYCVPPCLCPGAALVTGLGGAVCVRVSAEAPRFSCTFPL